MRRNEYMMKETERQQLKDFHDASFDIERQAALEDALAEEAYEDFLYLEVYTELSRKSKSRIRHHNDEKAKIRVKNSAAYLASKLNKLSLNATAEEDSRLYARTIAAEKKAARLK